MDDLLKALQNKDKKAVRTLSKRLFTTKDGTINRAQISEFESYAPCRISVFELRVGRTTKIGGKLVYNDSTYSIG